MSHVKLCMNKLQFSINKIPMYLASKTKDERTQIMKNATTEAHRARAMAWKKELQNARRKTLDDSQKTRSCGDEGRSKRRHQ